MTAPTITNSIESKEAPMPTDPCQKAREIESGLIQKFGEPDFSCTTSYVKGVMVKVWCCVEGKRIVYYSFGHEHGCSDSGYDVYPCDSYELPPSVKKEITFSGEGNGCWVLLDQKQNPCRK